jgi:hypothetical protein
LGIRTEIMTYQNTPVPGLFNNYAHLSSLPSIQCLFKSKVHVEPPEFGPRA